MAKSLELQAGHELQGLRLLVTGNGEGLLETLLSFHHFSLCALLAQQECAPEPMEFCLPPVLLMLLHQRQCLS